MSQFKALWSDERAASLAENAVLLAVLTLGVMGGMTAMMNAIGRLMDYLGVVFTTAV